MIIAPLYIILNEYKASFYKNQVKILKKILRVENAKKYPSLFII